MGYKFRFKKAHCKGFITFKIVDICLQLLRLILNILCFSPWYRYEKSTKRTAVYVLNEALDNMFDRYLES